MQNKKVIVITGSIGTGKSAAVKIIKDIGFNVLDSDEIVHKGYEKGHNLYYKVISRFGKEILDASDNIDRQKLANIVFNDDNCLEDLNDIVHLNVINELMIGIDNCSDEIIFLDIPLVLERLQKEKEYGLKFDEIWLIYVSPEIQKERLIQRAKFENKDPEDVLKIINMQIPIDEKLSMVDEVIDNSGTIEQLKTKINELLKNKYKHMGW